MYIIRFTPRITFANSICIKCKSLVKKLGALNGNFVFVVVIVFVSFIGLLSFVLCYDEDALSVTPFDFPSVLFIFFSSFNFFFFVVFCVFILSVWLCFVWEWCTWSFAASVNYFYSFYDYYDEEEDDDDVLPLLLSLSTLSFARMSNSLLWNSWIVGYAA